MGEARREDRPYGLLRVIQSRFVAPLYDFRNTCQELDIFHATHYPRFNELVFSLVEGPDPAISGPAANAMIAKVQEYDRAERYEMGYGSGGNLSLRMEEMINICETAAGQVEQLIANFPPADPHEERMEVWIDELPISRGLGAPNDVYLVTLKQRRCLDIMGETRARWAANLNGLVDESIDPATRLPDVLETNNLVLSFFTLPPVELNADQKAAVARIMATLAAMGITGIPYDYVAALIARGFPEQDILNAITAWHNNGKTDQQIADLLFIAAFNYTIASYYRGGIPYGFESQEQYQSFTSDLCTGLKNAQGVGGDGHCVGAAVGGSAVTGAKYKTGAPFDEGRQSDYDIVLTDPELLKKAAAMGVKTFDDGLHTQPLDDDQLRALGLYDLAQQLSAKAGRPVHFLIYGSLVDTYSHAPYISFFNSSCSC